MEKLKQLTNNVEFMEKVLESTSEQEVRNLFMEKGVTLEENDIRELSEAINHAAKRSGVVPEEELSAIAGSGLGTVGTAIASGAVGVASGAIAVGVLGIAGAAYAFKRGMDYSESWWRTRLGGSKSSSTTIITMKYTSR